MKNNKNSEIKVAIITGIFGITGALITGIVSGYFSYKIGADNMEQKIENKISQVINVDNGDVEKALDYIIDENKDFKDKIELLENKNKELEDEVTEGKNENLEYLKTTDETEEQQISETGYVSLLSVAKVINACKGFEAKETGTMSLRGEDYANGFILHYYNNTEGVEFKLGGNYSKMKFKLGHLDETDKQGTFTLTYFLDGEVQPTITIQPEDPVKEEEIDLKNADILKLNWSNDKGYAEYGVAEVMVAE